MIPEIIYTEHMMAGNDQYTENNENIKSIKTIINQIERRRKEKKISIVRQIQSDSIDDAAAVSLAEMKKRKRHSWGEFNLKWRDIIMWRGKCAVRIYKTAYHSRERIDRVKPQYIYLLHFGVDCELWSAWIANTHTHRNWHEKRKTNWKGFCGHWDDSWFEIVTCCGLCGWQLAY